MTDIRVFGHYLNVPMILLALMDVVVVGFALYLSAHQGGAGAPLPGVLFALLGCAMAFLGKAAVGLYHSKFRATLGAVMLRTAVAFLLGAPVIVIAGLVLPLGPARLLQALFAGAIAYGLLGLMQASFFALADAGALQRRIIVLGSDRRALTIHSMRRRADRRGFHVVGYVPFRDSESVAGPLVTLEDSLFKYAIDNRIQEIVVALRERRNSLPIDDLVDCRFSGIEITDIAEFMEREAGKVPLDVIRSGWFVFDGNTARRAAEIVKRLIDVFVSLVLLMLFLPIIIVASVAIKRTEGWRAPLFYRQTRIGKDGKEFQLIKFRSMRVDAESDGKAVWASQNDDRVTSVGRILRKARIDEIPQFFNVLQGSMSLVGPRPERPEFVAELKKSIPYYAERHRIKPGVTGWAQLMYPYGASREDAREKLQYDLYYLKHRSVVLDLIVLLQTVEVVLFGKGAR